MDVLQTMAERWKGKAWDVGQLKTGRWSAVVHGHASGMCKFGSGETPQEALDDAIANFEREFPNQEAVKRKQLADAKADVERLTAELGEAA